MKNFYYVVNKQLESNGDVEETNGWKDVRVYRLENNEMLLIVDFEIEMEENSKEAVDEMLFDESYVTIGEQINLIQL